MSCNLRAFSSLTAKRRYTLKSPALAFLKLNMYGIIYVEKQPTLFTSPQHTYLGRECGHVRKIYRGRYHGDVL